MQVQEEGGPGHAIAPLSLARTAFVGRTLRGPVGQPLLIRSFADFQQIFGGLWQPSTLSYAVEQYFDNGGIEALIVRVHNGARPATLSLPAGGGTLQLQAVRPGPREFLRACVDYDNIAPGQLLHFNLTLQRIRIQGSLRVEDQETYHNVSLDPQADTFIGRMLADSDLLVPLEPLPAQRPEPTPDPVTGLPTGYVHANSDGDDGAPVTDYDLIGSAVERTGLFALSLADEFNFLCIPPISRTQDVGPGTLLVAARFCRERRALLIVDPPEGWATADDALASLRGWELCSEDAVMFFPRILAHDKLRGRFETFAPCGAVAGMLARHAGGLAALLAPDADEPVLRPGFRPVCTVPEDRRMRLAALGVNTLQTVRAPVAGLLRLRTLGAANAAARDWRYLNNRRLVLAIMGSIERGTRWVAVAGALPEVPELLESQVRQFLAGLHAAGVFGTLRPEDAWYVAADRRIEAAPERMRREFHFLVGVAAERPGEFHSFRISHSLVASQVRAVTMNQLQDPRPQSRPFSAPPVHPDATAHP